MANLKIGMSGPEVKEVQELLTAQGYDVGSAGADGILGPDTERAIKAYQKDNGLTIDGIAGKDTLGLLYGSSSGGSNSVSAPTTAPTTTPTTKDTPATATPTTTPTEPAAPTAPTAPTAPATSTEGFTYEEFNSEIVNQANALIQQHMANQPGEWSDPYRDKWMGYLTQYENRGPFSYDFNSDALYQQYKDQYIQQGQMAMMDTMGQAAAMTGGYGNSYAQSVGQQTYNQYLGKLNEVMPELYGMAYDRYQQEGQELLNMYGIYSGLSSEDYGRHQDTVDNWYRDLDYLTGERDSAYNREWNDYVLGYGTAEKDYFTNKDQEFDTVENQKDRDAKKQAEAFGDLKELIVNTGHVPSAEELAAAGMTQSQAESYLKSYNEGQKDTKKAELIDAIKNGYEPTQEELDAVGMTKAQADAYKPKATVTETGKTEEVKYEKMDIDAVEKKFARATTIKEVDDLAGMYRAEGYNPETIKILARQARDRIVGTYNPETDPDNPTGTTGSGGGGGGRFYATYY